MNDKTISFFKEISEIPRGSGNEKKISNYVCEFAQKRGLDYNQDEYGNVIIRKYNGKNSPIILQAHLDMVCEKEDDSFDFEKDAIEVYEDDGYLKAKGTTLGADNGIGVAQILNVLDDDLPLNIEAIFTVEEETTMCGAEKIDISSLKGKQMLNLDGFEEKTVIIESASFFDIMMYLNYEFQEAQKKQAYKIKLQGMKGGHSGFDIDKNRGNSSQKLAKFLKKIEDIEIIDFVGGTKFNVIPSQAECSFYSDLSKEELEKIRQEFEKKLRQKYPDSNLIIETENKNGKKLSNEDSKKFLDGVVSFKHGIYFKEENVFVTTSANLGVVDLKDNCFKIGVRSSRRVEERQILQSLQKYAEENKYKFEILGSQPGFETRKESNLVKKLCESYKNVIGDGKLQVKPVHITVECGFFEEKIPGLEVAIISPKIIGAHTTSERVEIKSIAECDRWIYEFLKSFEK